MTGPCAHPQEWEAGEGKLGMARIHEYVNGGDSMTSPKNFTPHSVSRPAPLEPLASPQAAWPLTPTRVNTPSVQVGWDAHSLIPPNEASRL